MATVATMPCVKLVLKNEIVSYNVQKKKKASVIVDNIDVGHSNDRAKLITTKTQQVIVKAYPVESL